jgi:hypothetical protein
MNNHNIKLHNLKIPPRLEDWEEIKGTLIDLKKHNNYIVLTFYSRIDVLLDEHSPDFEEKLNNLTGKRISILSTDSSVEKYRIRMLNKRDFGEGLF